MSLPYRALIADDEPVLRHHLNTLLADLWPELEIVDMASDGEQAWQQVQEQSPDLAFLDIRMPRLDGIALASRFGQLDKPPLVVFITAYDEHAVQAFENEAVDYLLKPIDEVRLEKTITRLQQRLAQRDAGQPGHQMRQLKQLLQQIIPGGVANQEEEVPERLKWIKASKRDCVHILPVAEVDCFQAESKYTTVCSQDQEYLIRTSIVQLEQQLDPDLFWRIHRNCIVRVDGVTKVERSFDGNVSVLLKEGKRLAVSRRYQWRFRQM